MADKTSVLIVDDTVALLRVYKEALTRNRGLRIATATNGAHAFKLATRQLYDAVVIDAKLSYRGLSLGGLRLAEDLAARYGTHSVLVMSSFITAQLMHQEFGLDVPFLEKAAPSSFCDILCARVKEMRDSQYAFVAMPFGGQWDALYREHIKPGVTAGGLRCLRADEVTHTQGLQERMLDLVARSKLLVLLADDGNANAYYEAGYADALGKEVVVVTRSLKALKVDVSHRNALVYEGNGAKLAAELKRRVAKLRLEVPPGV